MAEEKPKMLQILVIGPISAGKTSLFRKKTLSEILRGMGYKEYKILDPLEGKKTFPIMITTEDGKEKTINVNLNFKNSTSTILRPLDVIVYDNDKQKVVRFWEIGGQLQTPNFSKLSGKYKRLVEAVLNSLSQYHGIIYVYDSGMLFAMKNVPPYKLIGTSLDILDDNFGTELSKRFNSGSIPYYLVFNKIDVSDIVVDLQRVPAFSIDANSNPDYLSWPNFLLKDREKLINAEKPWEVAIRMLTYMMSQEYVREDKLEELLEDFSEIINGMVQKDDYLKDIIGNIAYDKSLEGIIYKVTVGSPIKSMLTTIKDYKPKNVRPQTNTEKMSLSIKKEKEKALTKFKVLIDNLNRTFSNISFFDFLEDTETKEKPSFRIKIHKQYIDVLTSAIRIEESDIDRIYFTSAKSLETKESPYYQITLYNMAKMLDGILNDWWEDKESELIEYKEAGFLARIRAKNLSEFFQSNNG